MPIQPINAATAPPPLGDYVQGMAISGPSRMLILSGQIGIDAQGHVPDTFEEQARLAWRNVLAQLHAAGMDVHAIVKTTFYLTDRGDLAANGRIRAEIFGDHRCASTAVIVGLLDPSWRLEIDVVACQDDGPSHSDAGA